MMFVNLCQLSGFLFIHDINDVYGCKSRHKRSSFLRFRRVGSESHPGHYESQQSAQ